MSRHGVPWHHPLGTSALPHSGSSHSDYPCHSCFQDGTLADGWQEPDMQVFNPAAVPAHTETSFLSRWGHRACQSSHCGLTTSLPSFSIALPLLTALWHNGCWWHLKPMKYVPTSGSHGLCTHCRECASPGSLTSFIHDCITEDFLPLTILKVPLLSLFLATLLYYLHSTSWHYITSA